jgi:hypothetical protein
MAEVKVKITAQNETQTGFQAVLADAQKTAAQVRQTMSQASDIRTFQPRMPSSGPINVDIGDYGLEPLRELQKQLADVRRSAQEALDPQTATNFGEGIAGLVGRFALLIGVAATVGKVISSAFDRLSESVKTATEIQEQFNRSVEAAGTATSLEGSISAFKQLNSLAEQTNKTLKESQGAGVGEALANALSGRPGQLLARIADTFTLGSVSGGLQDSENRQRQIARESLLGSLARQTINAEELAGAGGDPAAIERVQREQQRRQERERLANALKNESSELLKAAQTEQEAAFAAEDRAIAAKELFETEKQIAREKEKQASQESGTRLGNVIGRQLGPGSFEGIRDFQREQEAARKALGKEFGPGTTEAATGGFRVDAANFALKQQEELMRIAQGARPGMIGTSGSSQLQRIGFASNEFFDTRRQTSPADIVKEIKRNAEFTKQVADFLKKGEPLVLNPT